MGYSVGNSNNVFFAFSKYRISVNSTHSYYYSLSYYKYNLTTYLHNYNQPNLPWFTFTFQSNEEESSKSSIIHSQNRSRTIPYRLGCQ